MKEATGLRIILRKIAKEEAMKQKVHVFLSLPNDYKINWKGGKEQLPRISSRGFLDPKNEKDQEILSGMDLRWDWNYLVEVEDHKDSELPEKIYATIFCSGEYRGEFGGSSWFAHKAFVSKENAEKRIEGADSEWERWWVIEIHRKR